MNKYLKLLNEYKCLVGLNDWKVGINKKVLVMGDSYANTDIDYYEKIVKVNLSKAFMKEPFERKKNILFHELLHTRYLVLESKVKKMSFELEEEFINDVTRGLEIVGKFKN